MTTLTRYQISAEHLTLLILLHLFRFIFSSHSFSHLILICRFHPFAETFSFYWSWLLKYASVIIKVPFSGWNRRNRCTNILKYLGESHFMPLLHAKTFLKSHVHNNRNETKRFSRVICHNFHGIPIIMLFWMSFPFSLIHCLAKDEMELLFLVLCIERGETPLCPVVKRMHALFELKPFE